MRISHAIITVTLTTLSILGSVRSAQAMTILPPDYNLTVNPGDTIKDVLHVFNEDPFPVTLQPKLWNFTSTLGDEASGSPDFYPADEDRDGHGLASWITLESSAPFTIAPKERVNIPFTITVPPNAQPGGHFGAIHIGTTQLGATQDKDPQVGILAATSALLFVRVGGDVRDDMAIRRFETNRRFSTHLPVIFGIRMENNGSTHLTPVGNILISDMFGREVATLPINAADKRRVLPGSIRRFDVPWIRETLPVGASELRQQWKNFAFGKYTATVILNYGDPAQQKTLTATTEFWVLSWMVIGIALASVLILWLLARTVLRHYDRHVILRYEAAKKQGKN